MAASRFLWLAPIVAAAAAAAFLLLAPPASAGNDPDPSGGSVYGDWEVEDSLTYSSTTIYIESGNITVKAGGTLDLSQVALRFNSSSDGLYGLEVQAGGTLTTGNGTSFGSNRSDIHYRFVVKGAMTMNATTVSEMWGDGASWAGGVQLFSDNVQMTNSTVQYGRTGGISIFNCSPVVSSCVVQYNGQDGQSPDHAFGIYGYNTAAGITSCQVAQNTFLRMDYTALTLTKNPTSGTLFWNGNYYSGSATAAYRYEYNYWTNRTSVFGIGIVLEGGSTASLAGNTVAKNGWTAAGSYTPYTAIPVKVEDSVHTVRYYIYQYLNNNLYGTGILVKDSAPDIRGNTLDRNGCEPTTSSYYSYASQSWFPTYSGCGISMVGSGGNITGNTVTNSVRMLNLTRSGPLISDNTLTADYLTYSLVAPRTAHGILMVESTSTVRNNTVSLRVQDYQMTVDGVATFMMETMVGIDIIDSPGITIEGNRVTTETYSAMNYVAGICLNATLLSDDLRVVNNTLEHKATGTGVKANVQFSAVAQFTVLSHAHLENNIIRATVPSSGAAAGNVGTASAPTTVVGLAVSYGTVVTVQGLSVTGPHIGVLVTDFSEIRMERTNISACAYMGLRAESGCTVEMDSSAIASTGSTLGIFAMGAVIDIRDSRLANPLEFQLDKGASVNLYNTTHTTESFTALDNGSWLNVSWPVVMKVTWQDGRPAGNASLDLRTVDGSTALSTRTGPDGTPAPVVWVPEYVVHDARLVRYWPHIIEVSLGRASSREIFIFKARAEVTLVLVDSVPPALAVARPLPGERLNDPALSIRGEASDAETGIRDGYVQVKIDTFEWAQVPVVGGFWSYSPVLSDGFHTFVVRATDGLGNTARAGGYFSLDTTAPVLSLLGPADGSHVNQRTVTVSGVSEPGAVISVNGMPVDLLDRRFSAQLSLEEGQNEITVAALDDSGNTRTVVVQVELDTKVPALEILSPNPDTVTNEDYVTVLGTSEPSVLVTVNGLGAPLYGSGFETVVPLSMGQNRVTVVVTDLAGNVNRADISVTMDTVLPDLTVASPLDGAWTNRPAVEVSGLTEAGATVTVNGLATGVTDARFSCTIMLEEGENAIGVESRDLAGNRNTVSLTVYLDTAPPDLELQSPAAGLVTPSRQLWVSGSVGLVTELTVNGKAVLPFNFEYSTLVTFPSDGTYAVDVVARDLAGNTATVSRNVTVDTLAPGITILSPPEGSKVKGGVATITGRTEPGATVWTDEGGSVRAGSGGNFTLIAALETGQNFLVLHARDAAGNTGARTLQVSRPAAEKAQGPGALGEAAGLVIEGLVALAIAALVILLVLRLAAPKAPPAPAKKTGNGGKRPKGGGPPEKAGKKPGPSKDKEGDGQ